MERMKRFVCLMLCLLMIIGTVPVGAIAAAGTPTIVIAGSDYQNTNGGLFSSGAATDAYAIMSQIKEDYDSAYGFLFGGDYYAHNTNTTTESTDGKNQLKGEIVDVLYPDMADDTQVYIQGNHDADVLTTNGTLTTSGAHDTEKYGVYVINEKDYMWYNGDKTTIQNTATALDKYLDDKAVEGYKKPIFVLSHLPLHYTNRTKNEGDGKYAKYLYDVLDEAGDQDLNVIFLYGHNHSTAYDSYLGNGSVYLPEGSSIAIANEGSTSSYFNDTLSFTYMNYGFVGYVGSSDTDAALTMTVFEIYDDEVLVKRYDENGLHNLKSAGGTTQLPSGLSADSTVIDANGTAIALTVPTSTDEDTRVEIDVPTGGGSGDTSNGTIWRQVTSFTEGKNYMLVNYGDNASGVGTFAVNSTAGGTAVTVQTDSTGAYIENDNMALAWTYNANAELTNADTNQYLYIANYPSGTSGVKVNVTGSVTTGTSYSSWKLATNTGVNEVSLSAYRNGSSSYYPARWSNGGSEYLAYTSTQTSKHDNWIAIFEQTSEGGSTGGGSDVETSGGNWVTITEPSSGETIFRLTNSLTSGKKYVIVNRNTAGNGNAVNLNSSSINSTAVTVIADSEGNYIKAPSTTAQWTYNSSKNFRNVSSTSSYLRGRNSTGSLRVGSSSSSYISWTYDGTYGLYSNSNNYTINSNFNLADRSSTDRVYIYEETTLPASNGLYGKLEGDLVYNVAYGTSEAAAKTIVQNGIAIKYATKSDYSDEDTFDDNGEGMKWEFVNYDGNTPGEYAVNIYYNTTLLGTAKVIVAEASASSKIYVSIDSKTGSVKQNAKAGALTGSELTVTDANGNVIETVDVTVSMLKDANGNPISTEEATTLTGLKVYYTYNGVEYCVCENYTLNIQEKILNNYPDYPNEGSVKVGKTGTGIDFQSSGIAKVELSASGVPAKKGADVIVMVDTSSSMKRGAGTNSEVSAPNRRIDFLQTAIADLIEQFQVVGADGEHLDIRMAIAEFNGYDFISSNDHPTDSSQQGASNVAEVFTGDNSKGAGAFVQATSITNPDAFAANIGAHSGTNYDYAFDTIYRLGTAIQTENENNNEERDLYVIFMSDGAPYGYNYYGSGTTTSWEHYLNGTLPVSSLSGNTHFYRTDTKHWMAEAVKGATTATYPVIDPEWGTSNALGTDASADYGNYFSYVPGLGATTYSIGFCLYDDAQSGGTVTAATQKKIMSQLASVDASGNALFYETESGEGLANIFKNIGSEIAYAATNARFIDTMGADYDLQLATVNYAPEGSTEKTETITPVIEVKEYAIYTRQDYLEGECAESQIGDRTGGSTVIETVTFNTAGTEAYSSLIDVNGDGTKGGTGDNILGSDGVIYAKNFAYNTNKSAVSIDANNDGTAETTIEGETFFWNLGTIKTTELALSYYVYLTGSMEGNRDAGSYPTNESATLWYTNYLGTENCYKDTVSPVLAWEGANVSYAFYLVNANGQPVNANGDVVTFANKVEITQPVVYKEIYLNNLDNVNSIDVASSGVLPDGYDLYDDTSVYTVTINSNSTGKWDIVYAGNDMLPGADGELGTDDDVENTATSGKNPSTYVTNFSSTVQYSQELNETDTSYDYTHTVVWFAVVWTPKCVPDVVVIDYGLPVDIHVLTNDMFGDYGRLTGVTDQIVTGSATGDDNNQVNTTTADGEHGTAVAYPDTDRDHTYIRYTPADMEMNTEDVFTYSVNYTGSTNSGYYYGTVTVIPATTIYYEDDFMIYTASNTTWEKAMPEDGEVVTQDEDRPGKYSLSYIDANNVYGYDSAYTSSSEFSLSNAMKVSVDADSHATATFSYWGTGFDVISLTSNKTGVLAVKVYDYDAYKAYQEAGDGATKPATIKTGAVNTYYGYDYVDGQWQVTTTNDENALYQIPVMQAEGLGYGHYTVEISAQYFAAMDKTGNNGYDLYLDAVRIYDPAGVVTGGVTNETISNAYTADGEGWPQYIEVRNNVIAADTFDNGGTEANGLIFIDGKSGDVSMADYISYGPNNELYLASGQSVAFKLDMPTTQVDIDGDGHTDTSIVADVQVGLKLAAGDSVTYKIYNASNTTAANATSKTLNTATDMYYSIKDIASGNVVITNAGSAGVLSITNVKVTYVQNPNGINAASVEDDLTSEDELAVASEVIQEEAEIMTTSLYMDAEGANAAVMSLRSASVEPEEPEIEETVPETTEPEETVPETTEPEETVPETTEPEETVPETTEPEETVPETTEPEEDDSDSGSGLVGLIRKLLGWLFG